MGATGTATARRTFWWDRACPVDADVHPLRAVVFDADSALGQVGGDDDLVPRAGLIDLVMSLFVEGIWVAVVSRQDREHAQTSVRQLIGDGLVETIVSADDLDQPGSASELYRLALWELGVRPESALAVGGSASSLRAARVAGLP
ncbi:MAG: HAD family hydrolase, partial [Mycobacterium sp.]|uniref:HAD family hydrolase n=1 Tax=Mycobacterium sp. TaxID=1785 RepID=UPI003CC59BB3